MDDPFNRIEAQRDISPVCSPDHRVNEPMLGEHGRMLQSAHPK